MALLKTAIFPQLGNLQGQAYWRIASFTENRKDTVNAVFFCYFSKAAYESGQASPLDSHQIDFASSVLSDTGEPRHLIYEYVKQHDPFFAGATDDL